MKLILNYTLGGDKIANPDGTAPAQSTGVKVAEGPGATQLNGYPKSLDFAPSGSVIAPLPTLPADAKWTVRLLLKTAAADTRQTILSCSGIPIGLAVDKSADAGKSKLSFRLFHPQSGPVTVTAVVPTGKWVLLDAACDIDTLALFVDQKLADVAAFPALMPVRGIENTLTIGCPPAAAGREPFSGQMAALQLIDGIPENLENDLDAQRALPGWHISLKANQIRPAVELGKAEGALAKDAKTGSFFQAFQKGIVCFDPIDGYSAEMHGAIYDLWKSQPDLQTKLGTLQWDEMNAGKANTRKSVFENGIIFWSAATGAVAIVGEKWAADYVRLGEAAYPGGLPKSPAAAITGGWRQDLQNGALYFNAKGNVAFGMHGVIAEKYKSAGGFAKWGMPTSDVEPLQIEENKTVKTKGNILRLEKDAAIFQKASASSAFILDGKILTTYLQAGGATGSLGFPVSDAKTVATGIKHAGFENGAIVQIGAKAPVIVSEFNIFLSRVETDESEGFELTQDENDLYMHFYVRQNGHEVYHKRYPESGDIERNIVEPKLKTQSFNPADPNLVLALELDVWEADWGDDDHIGVFKKELNIQNLWGLAEKPDGIFTSGKISQINNVHWAVQPAANKNTPFDFWETGNAKTPTISLEQFAVAFRDVDSDPEWYSPADWLRRLYYELAVKDIAAGGNCFGESTEAIYAWKELSPFARPLKRFTDFASIKNEVNIKQCYQVGTDPILWFLKQLVTLNTRNPKNVFKETRDFFKSGMNPVLCIASNWKFDDGHCLMPFEWDDSAKPWKIRLFDPNKKNVVQTVLIDPDKNTFTYLDKYKGGAGLDHISEGHLHYMPWSVICRPPMTPVGSLIDLGASLLMGASTSTETLTDAAGNNLLANLSPESLVSDLENKFFSIPGLNGANGALSGELLIRPKGGNQLLKDYRHEWIGTSAGDMSYGFKWKRQAFQLASTVGKSEKNALSMEKLGAEQQKMSLQSPKNKLLKFTTEQKLGNGTDYVQIDISRIPVKAGLATQMSIQPGGNAVDILSGPDAVDAQITVSGSMDGKKFSHSYDTRLEGGTRFVLSHAAQSGILKAGKIDRIFGQMNESVFVRRK